MTRETEENVAEHLKGSGARCPVKVPGGADSEMDDNERTLVMRRLEPFVGRWTMEALFPGAEPTGPVGLSTFEWMLGGQFLVQRTEFSAPGPPGAVTIVGPDPDGPRFTQHYFLTREASSGSMR